MKYIYCFLLFLAFQLRGYQATAQEFNFQVKVVNPQARVADPKVFQSLEAALRELVNNTKWTDDIFEQNERITGTLQLTIKAENSATSFSGSLAMSASRPVYGADYLTPLFTHLDAELNFSYEQFQPLQFAKNAFNDNLSSTIAYYMYVILGMDYDSYALQGGEQFWQTAQDIYNTVPSGIKAEWQGRELGNRNRYWFVENTLSPRLKGFRQSIYEIHRQALDYAHQDMNRCKNVIMQALERMDEAQQSYPNTLAIRTFVLTKGDEFINIFKSADSGQKNRFREIMARLDPANSSKYAQVGL
jgi:hypothetical protein